MIFQVSVIEMTIENDGLLQNDEEEGTDASDNENDNETVVTDEQVKLVKQL
jgi:hypothetical protein